MKKYVLAFFYCILLLPMTVMAQTEQATTWELTQVAYMDSLGIQFNVPDGWVQDPLGFGFAENEGDFENLTDSDAATQPQGFVILMFAIPLTPDESGMPTVEKAVDDLLLSSREIPEYQHGIVNLRPSISLNTDDTFITYWIQNEFLISLYLLMPEQTPVNEELVYTWEQILASVQPILPPEFEFADTPYEVSELSFSVPYPEGWATADTNTVFGFPGAMFAQDARDIGRELGSEVLISIFRDLNRRFAANLSSETVTPDEFTFDAAQFFQTGQVDWEGEFQILAQQGIAISYDWACCELSVEPVVYYNYLILTRERTTDTYFWYMLSAPNEELFNIYLPIFLKMLQDIEPLAD